MIGTSLPAQGESVSPRETLRTWGEQTPWRFLSGLVRLRLRVSEIDLTPSRCTSGNERITRI